MNGHRCGPFDCTYTPAYVACGVCHQRWFWTDHGWEPLPRLGPARWGSR